MNQIYAIIVQQQHHYLHIYLVMCGSGLFVSGSTRLDEYGSGSGSMDPNIYKYHQTSSNCIIKIIVLMCEQWYSLILDDN